ncbi:MAG: hypothetical protein PHW83_12365 [Bacteroidales bacterium]|nr:hypothetical protein [Bacteroidales bacterium]
MKTFALILSIYILALTIVPCFDSHLTGTEASTELCQKNNDPDTSDTDLCSPFCTCSCCGTSISFELLVFLNTTIVTPSVLKFHFRTPDITEIAFAFWQPPKIS